MRIPSLKKNVEFFSLKRRNLFMKTSKRFFKSPRPFSVPLWEHVWRRKNRADNLPESTEQFGWINRRIRPQRPHDEAATSIRFCEGVCITPRPETYDDRTSCWPLEQSFGPYKSPEGFLQEITIIPLWLYESYVRLLQTIIPPVQSGIWLIIYNFATGQISFWPWILFLSGQTGNTPQRTDIIVLFL